ncbi:hypothetical protein [Holospora curviuscula]|uniref:Uncharacterized protein n=1 Tax=Holospora curviuscula TaxID=1082868 RepID=A0A2S5R8R0_9PROT|nr:hypothetical protein [Holospora curviuscula]PPE03687.1 hypothetical protein HCUR_00825 [Holospora curviuscula]
MFKNFKLFFLILACIGGIKAKAMNKKVISELFKKDKIVKEDVAWFKEYIQNAQTRFKSIEKESLFNRFLNRIHRIHQELFEWFEAKMHLIPLKSISLELVFGKEIKVHDVTKELLEKILEYLRDGRDIKDEVEYTKKVLANSSQKKKQ